MRLIKLGNEPPAGFLTLADVQGYFENPDSPFRNRGQYATFCFPDNPPAIGTDGLRPGETLLFSYANIVRYVATAWSGRMDSPGPDRATLPYCFQVNVASLRRTEFSVQTLENAIRALCEQTGHTTNIVNTQGWPRLPDGVEAEAIVIQLVGGH